MRRKIKRKVILSPRDYEILKDLFFNKVCDLLILQQRHFLNSHKTTVRKRMDKLALNGLINKFGAIGLKESRVLYSITPKGLGFLTDYFSEEVQRKECQSTNVFHDLALAHIKNRLERSKSITEIRTENEIQSLRFYPNDDIYEPFRRLNSDLFIKLSSESTTYHVAVEFERIQKSHDRWYQYLLNYHLEDKIDAVLYICETSQVKSSMEKIESSLTKEFSPKVYFCDLEKFMSDDSKVTFINCLGQSFSLHFQ